MTDLNYSINGSGEPIILIHSGGTDSRDWKFIEPVLSKKFKVIAYDTRGAGKSPVPLKPVDHLKDLQNLMNHLAIEQAFLAGHSLGGQIAADFSILHPNRVKGLILVAPGLTGFEYDKNFKKMNERMWKSVPDTNEMLTVMLNSNEAYAISIGLNGMHSEFIRRIHLDNIKKSLEWKNFETDWPIKSSAEKLTEIKAPTLYLHPTQDKADLQRIKKRYEQVPTITFKNISNSDHSLTWTHYDQISELMTEFLKD